jgi:diaminopimelate decarboxylase
MKSRPPRRIAELNDERFPTPAGTLARILTRTDRLSIDGEGRLRIEGCPADALLQKYGSPLYVISEATLRANVRRVTAAFSALWPEEVTILYAIKANNNLAVRAIMNQEGAGGDCFGEGEFHATFAGGADPAKVVLNGSNKNPELILKAVGKGVTINIDAEDELAVIEEAAAGSGKTARVKLRLKVVSAAYNEIVTDYFGGDRLADYVRRAKWGFSIEAAGPLVARILSSPRLNLLGYHFHIGRTSASTRFFRLWADALCQSVIELHRQTGYSPKVLNVGGGWPRERDPESRSLEINKTTLEEYAAVVCSSLRRGLATAGLPTPQLWLEPGRFIVGNAAVLLVRVGAVKRDFGFTWINLDASTNNLMRIDTSRSAHHVFPAAGMTRAAVEHAIVVGETCIDSVFSPDCLLPPLERGEPMAILDAGMYAETASTQLNGIPRPATVLVNGSSSDLIKERETVADVFAKHRIPDRLR